MRIVRRCLGAIAADPAAQLLVGLLVLIGGLSTVAAQDDAPPTPSSSRDALLAVPSFQGELPDGTPVFAIIVIPAENILNKNAAWRDFERQWATTYQIRQPAGESSNDP